MTVAIEQPNFFCDEFRTFPFSADVSTEKKVFFLVVGGRTAKYQRVVRLSCTSL
jgi:hypothetical protein